MWVHLNTYGTKKGLNWRTSVDSAGISRDAVTRRLWTDKSLKQKNRQSHIYHNFIKNTFPKRIYQLRFSSDMHKIQREQSEAVGVLMRGWTYGLLTHQKAINADCAVFEMQNCMQKRVGWSLCWVLPQNKWGPLREKPQTQRQRSGRRRTQRCR